MKRTTLRRKPPLKIKRVKKAKKKKAPSVRLLKKKLWTECKRIIRAIHGNTCYTCGASPLEGSNWQTGHFIASSVCSTELRYSLDNLRPQCYRCNINLSGNWIAFERHLIADGIDVALLKQRNEDTKGESYRDDWYLTKIKEYRLIATD